MKRFKTVASIMLTCLAVSFIIGTAYVYVKSITSNVRSQQMNDVVSAEPQLMAEDNSVRFNSIAEYVAYLNSSEYVCQNTLEQNQASSASQDYYLPGVLPSNTSLASITMNDEGTTFTYSYDIDFSNIFDFNTDDDVIAEMTRNISLTLFPITACMLKTLLHVLVQILSVRQGTPTFIVAQFTQIFMMLTKAQPVELLSANKESILLLNRILNLTERYCITFPL